MEVTYVWTGPGWYATAGGADHLTYQRLYDHRVDYDAPGGEGEYVDHRHSLTDAMRQDGWYFGHIVEERPENTWD